MTDKDVNVDLEVPLNPEYWKLISDANALFGRWNRLELPQRLYRVPRFPFFGAKRRLNTTFEGFDELQADSNRWLTRSSDFFRECPPKLADSQRPELTLWFAQRRVDRLVDQMQVRKYVAHYGFQILLGALEQRRNFQIAIASFLLAVLAFVYSILFTNPGSSVVG